MLTNSDVFRGLGVKVTLPNAEDFLKTMETLTRIGTPEYDSNTLTQLCHILHKKGEYAIMHYKEMLVLDGRPNEMSEEDVLKRNRIAYLLDEWGLVDLVDPLEEDDTAPMAWLKIIPHKEKIDWNLQPMYILGRKKGPTR